MASGGLASYITLVGGDTDEDKKLRGKVKPHIDEVLMCLENF